MPDPARVDRLERPHGDAGHRQSPLLQPARRRGRPNPLLHGLGVRCLEAGIEQVGDVRLDDPVAVDEPVEPLTQGGLPARELTHENRKERLGGRRRSSGAGDDLEGQPAQRLDDAAEHGAAAASHQRGLQMLGQASRGHHHPHRAAQQRRLTPALLDQLLELREQQLLDRPRPASDAGLRPALHPSPFPSSASPAGGSHHPTDGPGFAAAQLAAPASRAYQRTPPRARRMAPPHVRCGHTRRGEQAAKGGPVGYRAGSRR